MSRSFLQWKQSVSQIVLLMLLAALMLPPALWSQQIITVHTSQMIREAWNAAQPGDIIEVQQGRYNLEGLVSVTRGGTADAPVIFRAKKGSNVTFVGETRFQFTQSAYVSIEGFEFSTTQGPAIELRACHHVRVTRNVFHLKESTRSSWVFVTGIPDDTLSLSHHNVIDHNLFEKKSVLGNFITIEGTKRKQPQVSQYDRIEQNHFRDIGPRVENVLEAIRIGSAEFTLSSGFTLLEKNLFERCDGDPEYVSVKSSDNIIRSNTFIECLGSLSLRHGNRNTIEGNYIFGHGRTGTFRDSTGKTWTLGTGGVRFCGDGMVIVNNYFESLTGTTWDATMAIANGDAEYGDGQPLTKHFRIRNALISHNTLVNNMSNLEIGYDGGGFQGNWWKLPPSGMVITNNIIITEKEPVVKFFTRPVDTRWEGNIVYTRAGKPDSDEDVSGMLRTDPKLVRNDGVWRLSGKSPAVNRAVSLTKPLLTDIEGQARDSKPDIGADEVSNAPRRNKPLTPKDVGPKAK